jgi:hypothetical protein
MDTPLLTLTICFPSGVLTMIRKSEYFSNPSDILPALHQQVSIGRIMDIIIVGGFKNAHMFFDQKYIVVEYRIHRKNISGKLHTLPFLSINI